MDNYLCLFGERLKEARKALELSQSEAADLTGVSRVHWGRCERGEAMPGGEVLAALAIAGANVHYILTGQLAGPAPEPMTEDEKGMLDDYREASGPVRRAARALLKAVEPPVPPPANVNKASVKKSFLSFASAGDKKG